MSKGKGEAGDDGWHPGLSPGRIIVFLLEFLAVSAIFLAVWYYVGELYQCVVLFFAAQILLASGYTAVQISAVNLSGAYLGNFNLVPLFALAIATPGWGLKERAKMLALGVPVLFLLHVLDLVAHFPMYFYGSGLARMVVYSIGVAGVAAPFIIWLVTGYRFFLYEGGNFRCPVCGAEEEDIIRHIKAVHGKGAFKSRKVKDFLDMHPELKRARRK